MPQNCLLFSGAEVQVDCTEEGMQIQGGHYTLTKQLQSGSLLVYHCPEGYYPFPVLTRLCGSNGTWRPAPKKFKPQRCRRESCGDDVSHFASGRLFYVITQLLLFSSCSCWMPRPQCAWGRKRLPSSGEVLCGQWDHVWVLLWIYNARLKQTGLLTKREVERLHAYL